MPEAAAPGGPTGAAADPLAWDPDGPRPGAARLAIGAGLATLRWTEWGPPDGAPVVCVHGLTRSGRDFDALARRLAARGRRVLCPDVFGRGLSDWLADPALYAVPAYAAALLPLLRGLGRPYDWVGTSMGGMIGMAVAATPESGLRRLVLNDVGALLPAEALARIGAYLSLPIDFADLPALEAHLRRIHATFGDLSDAQWRHLAATGARMTPTGRLVLHYDPAIAVAYRAAPPGDIALWPLWESLRQPVLLLRGAESGLLRPDTAARMATRPGVTLREIPGCGHAPALLDPAQTGPVAGFLAG